MKAGPERDLADRYLQRAAGQGRNIALAGFTVSEIAESRASAAGARKAEEATGLTQRIAEGTAIVALDERGRALDSEGFANFIGTRRDEGNRAMAFLVGGPDGLDRSVTKCADLVVNLSSLTWPHQIARILLAEQLYRATTILSGHPYHRA